MIFHRLFDRATHAMLSNVETGVATLERRLVAYGKEAEKRINTHARAELRHSTARLAHNTALMRADLLLTKLRDILSVKA